MAVGLQSSASQQERTTRKKPFSQWVKNLTGLKGKGGDQQEKGNTKRNGNLLTNSKYRKGQSQHSTSMKNNPYPESGHLQQRRPSQGSSANGQLSVASRPHNGSYGSLANSTLQEREVSASNRSGAPTVATNPETVHSDAGHSKAATTTTRGGALSSIDGAGADSTFSSPNQSQHSLTTTLTTIQSNGASNTLQANSGYPNSNLHGSLNNPNPVMFTHQYPVSPAPSAANTTISAIPRHLTDALPNTYNSATANGLLSDNASILTLASSSKRRRRSMDTDASVRAIAPGSVFGGSRESLPLSVLSGNADAGTARPSVGGGGGGIASVERASIYSAQGVGIAGSERNSYYSYKPGKDLTDAKSLRSITNLDGKSLSTEKGDVSSLRNYESSIRSGTAGHNRNDSIPGSISGPVSGSSLKHASGVLSRKSGEWQQAADAEENEEENEKPNGDGNEPVVTPGSDIKADVEQSSDAK